MSNLQLFAFEGTEIRIVGSKEDPWWVAADVCKALEQPNTSQVLGRLDEDEKGLQSVDTPGGMQEMLCINESGLYSLVLTSRKPQARRFKKWITSEVIPSIRKTGSYSVNSSMQISTPSQALLAVVQNMVEIEQNQRLMDARLKQQEELLNEHEAELDRLHSPDGHYFTVLGYGNLLGFKLSRKEAQVLGGAASRYCRKHGIRKETVYDSSFGTIGNYPQEVLQVVFKDAGYIAKGGVA